MRDLFMKQTSIILSLFFSIFLILSARAADASMPAASAENLNSVAAVVNNDVITQIELNQAIKAAKQQIAVSSVSNAINDAKLRSIILQQLIDQKLQLELAKRANITVTDAQVMQAIQNIAASHQLTVLQLKNKLKQQNLNYAAYLKMVHDQILLRQIEQSAVGNTIQITPQDIQNALAQYQSQMKTQQTFHVIDIVMRTKDKAQATLLQLNKGADINVIAPNNTTDLGWQTANTLPSIFLTQLTTMQSGDIAGPIQAPNGFHVIKLMGVRGQSMAQPTKAQLQNMAYAMKMQKAVEKWLVDLRKTAYIKITGEQ